jgi:hypothetical protein
MKGHKPTQFLSQSVAVAWVHFDVQFANFISEVNHVAATGRFIPMLKIQQIMQ